MNKLKVTFTVPESTIDEINKRCNGYIEFDPIKDINLINLVVRDELDKLTSLDNTGFLEEVIPQVINLVEYKFYKDYYDKLTEEIQKGIINNQKNGREKRVKHGRHAKK